MPAIFVMAPRTSMPNPSWMTPEARAFVKNRAGIQQLTGLTLGVPRPVSHEAIKVLVKQGALHVQKADEHVLEITFDQGRQGETFDARPQLPLIIHY